MALDPKTYKVETQPTYTPSLQELAEGILTELTFKYSH